MDVAVILSSAHRSRDEAEQEQAARASKESLEKSHRFSRPIVTQIVPAVQFYEAEDYHQQYLEKRGLASCHVSK